MITGFRHKGLQLLFESDDARKVPAKYVKRLKLIMLVLDEAETVEDLDLSTFHLHPLKGDLLNKWAVTVQANWRVVFKFKDGDAFDVDYMDYH